MNPPRTKPLPSEIPSLLREVSPDHRGKRKMGEPSITEMAEACGVERSAASQWLSGKTTPGEDKLVAISRYTGIPLSALVRARNLDVGLIESGIVHREGGDVPSREDENIMSVADTLVRRLEQVAALLRGSAERQETGLDKIDQALREMNDKLERILSSQDEREQREQPKLPTKLS